MSRSRAKGTAAETQVVAYLQGLGFVHAERRTLNGRNDRGDVAGIPDAVIEVKNKLKVELAEWLKETLTEKDNADARWGIVWFKRRGKTSPADWYVLMSGRDAGDLLKTALGIGEP